MKFKVGDMITAADRCGETDPLIKGIMKAKVNYVYRDRDIIIVDILEHKESSHNGRELAFFAKEGRFKLYKEPKETPESIVFKTKSFNAVVYRDGRKTIAKNKDNGETAIAICSPEDTYDFMTGAVIAMARLTGTNSVIFEKLISQK